MNSNKGMNAFDGNHPAYQSRKRLNHRGPLSIDVASAWYFITICAKDHATWSMRYDPVGRDDPIAPDESKNVLPTKAQLAKCVVAAERQVKTVSRGLERRQ